MCFTHMPASFLPRSGRQLFQILDIVLEWKGTGSQQLLKKPIMAFKKSSLFLLRSNSRTKQPLVSPAVNFHQTQTELMLRLPTDSPGIKKEKRKKIERRMGEVKEWILSNEAGVELNWRKRQNVDFWKDNSEVLMIHAVVTTVRVIYSRLLFSI